MAAARCIALAFAGKRPDEDVEETENPHGHFIGFIIREHSPEFIAVYGFEFIQGFAAQSSWHVHPAECSCG